MRKLRRMLSVAYAKLKKKLVRQTMQLLNEAGNLHADQNYQLWQKYRSHCATLVQRQWRGYQLRFLMIDEVNMKIW